MRFSMGNIQGSKLRNGMTVLHLLILHSLQIKFCSASATEISSSTLTPPVPRSLCSRTAACLAMQLDIDFFTFSNHPELVSNRELCRHRKPTVLLKYPLLSKSLSSSIKRRQSVFNELKTVVYRLQGCILQLLYLK